MFQTLAMPSSIFVVAMTVAGSALAICFLC